MLNPLRLMIRFALIFLFAIGCGIPAAFANTPSSEAWGRLQKVRVQLKWAHQFQFAGFYAAIEQCRRNSASGIPRC